MHACVFRQKVSRELLLLQRQLAARREIIKSGVIKEIAMDAKGGGTMYVQVC